MEEITAIDISLKYYRHTVFEHLSFSLLAGQKIALVGDNGSGKSSLCKTLAQNIELDDGEIRYRQGLRYEYIAQESLFNIDHTAHEWLYAEDEKYPHEEFSKRVDELLPKFSVSSQLHSNIKSLSGGQARQLEIIRALAQQPEVLILDEPTNHLDLKTLIELQSLIKDYPGTVLMVSHDRFFIDTCIQTIWELDDKKIYQYEGNYTKFVKLKQDRYQKELIEYQRRDAFLKKELEWVRAGVKARSTKDEGRLKRYYELLHRHEGSKPILKKYQLPIPHPQPLGNKILRLINADVPFISGDGYAVKGFNFDMEEGMRIGILGPNGSGKTTLLKAIAGNHSLDRGKIILGQNTYLNVQDQHRTFENADASIKEIISQGNIRLPFGEGFINVYAYLKKFLFTPKDLDKTISTLSGGQRARVYLADTLKTGGNVLVLDEPTNDLDIDMLKALEHTLISFDGCVIMVSHDRYFLDTICTHIIALEGDGAYTISTGGYTQYIQKYGGESQFWSGSKPISSSAKHIIDTKNADEKPEKNNVSPKHVRRQRAKMRSIEKNLQKIEEQIAEIEHTISEPGFFSQRREKVDATLEKLSQKRTEKTRLEDEWLRIEESISTSS